MHGDPQDLRERTLLDEGDALRRLARGLLDAGDVEDLVQSTCAAALEAPARIDGFLQPWLRATLQRLAATWRRSELRRRRREREAARLERHAASDPAAIAMQSELLRHVAEAVHELEEPFRSVVVLRFWRGLMPDAIARELGVPRNTVRSRLQRGLERLRQRLDGRYGERERWSAPLGVAVGVQQSVAMLAAGTTVLVAGMSMKGKLLMAAAALAVAAFFLPRLWQESAGSSPPSSSAPLAPVAAASHDPQPVPEAAQRREVVAAAREAVAADDVQVLVRDSVSHAPIAGATVLGHREPERLGGTGPYGQARWTQWCYEPDLELGITGIDGRARVRGAVHDCYLVARHQGLAGSAWFTANTKELIIDLAPDRRVTIRAVDAKSHPVAGLPLAARYLMVGSGARVLATPAALGITDAAGELHCPLRNLLSPFAASSPAVSLVPYLPGLWQRGGTAVDLDSDLRPVLVLQVPPLGSLRCELLDSEGRIRSCPTTIRFDETGSRGDGTRADPDFAELQWSSRFDETAGTWPRWGLGLHHTVWFSTGAGSHKARGDGPRFPGETGLIQARIDPGCPILTGRLVGEHGDPLRHREVAVRYQAHRSSGQPTVWTDEAGRFELPLDTSVTNTTLLWLLLTPSEQKADEPLLGCQCEPGQKLQPGKLDLGDLMLQRPPLLVSGRVQADGIEPNSVQLAIETATSHSDGTLRWEQCDRVLASREPGGAFAFFGFGISPPLRLYVSGTAPMPAIPFAPGTRDLVVRVARGGSIQGEFEAEGARDGAYRLELLEEGAQEVAAERFVSGRRGFEFSGLAPGFYTVRLLLRGDPEPLAQVQQVRVDAGVATRDPRLRPIVVSDPVHSLKVSARAVGKPAPNGVVLVSTGGDAVFDCIMLNDGEATLWTRRSSVDLWICSRGYAPVLVRAATSDVQIDFEPPRELLVRVAAPALPPGFVLQWDFEAVHPDPRVPSGQHEWFGYRRRLRPTADGTCTVPILSDQPSRIVCHVQRLNSDYWWLVPVTPAELPAGAGAATVSVQAADIQAAIRHLPDRDG